MRKVRLFDHCLVVSHNPGSTSDQQRNYTAENSPATVDTDYSQGRGGSVSLYQLPHLNIKCLGRGGGILL